MFFIFIKLLLKIYILILDYFIINLVIVNHLQINFIFQYLIDYDLLVEIDLVIDYHDLPNIVVLEFINLVDLTIVLVDFINFTNYDYLAIMMDDFIIN